MTAKTTNYEILSITTNFDDIEWWQATARDELAVRLCCQCGWKFYPPAPICPNCHSNELSWYVTSGRGVVQSYCVAIQPTIMAFAGAVPYVGASIRLDGTDNPDGSSCLVPGMLLDEEEAVAIGSPVSVVFEQTCTEGFKMPRWRVTGKGESEWKFVD